MPSLNRSALTALTGLACAAATTAASAASVTITVENLSPDGGLFTTPVWVGFHNGAFDLFDVGAAATPGLEAIAEDGSFAAVAAELEAATGGTGLGGAVTAPGGFAGAPVFEAGETGSATFEIDAATQGFLSFGAMVLPSNDAFFGTDDAIQLFDDDGVFFGDREFTFARADLFDAGTELNTELDAAFLNQTGPDTGETENGVIALHPGFIGSVGGPAAGPNGESASILGGTVVSGDVIDATAGDFTASGFDALARVTITLNPDAGTGTAVPAPSAFGAGLLGLFALARRRSRVADTDARG